MENHESCSEKGMDASRDSSPVSGDLSSPAASESKVPEVSAGNSRNVLAECEVSAPGGAASMKAGHPAFLSEFYGHSRLHHISTAGQELKRYVQSLAESNAERIFPAREKLKVQARTSENFEFGGDSPLENMRVVMHLDMDCFFVSVGLRNHPELRGQPIAVTHSKGKRNGIQDGSDPLFEANHYANESKKKLGGVFHVEEDSIMSAVDPPKISKYSKEFGSLSEIASCSYEAREAGIRNGMFLGEAMRRCPNLKTIPYDFEGYSEVSKQLYDIVASYTLDVEAVSCDELYIECTELLKDTGIAPLLFASILRSEIKQKTGCTASAGLGSNMLLARLGNRRAKPNGQYFVQEEEVEDFMKEQKVRDLPGVGYTTSKRLEQAGVSTCGDLQSWPLSRLQKEFGPKTGSGLYDRCRGKCDRKVQVQKERKSVSAEINYGIRFEEDEEVYKFINELAVEVQNRLQNINSKGKSVTLKLMIRRPEAPVQTAKFMGHGVCNSISKSILLKTATSDASIIGKECCSLVRMLKIKPQDHRGIGIQISKLESNQREEKSFNALESFLCKEKNTNVADNSNQEIFSPKKLREVADASPQEKNSIKDLFSKKAPPQKPVATFEAKITLEQIDQSVLDALPEDIRNEVLQTYRIPETSWFSNQSTSQKSSKSTVRTQSKSRVLNNKKSNKRLPSTSRIQSTNSIVSAFRKEVATVEEPPRKKKKATLGGVEDINDIRNLIKEWMQNSEGILEEDVEQFKNYLLDIVEEDLEKLNLILKYFYRLCSAAEKKWQEVYLKCLAYVQKKMLQSYGSMLEAKTQF
ncbi:DNA repair protein REV1-like [Uloborus diversus]|uniref:DNA repair protein REV1-like n=1 Tax=Uloborus diversus TaxID=327109 RepID=UPI00240A68D4|nr:DNA repair protein REV1-like [Uloborus diversus]